MKISLNWIRDYINLPDEPDRIAHMLTMSGLEVEGIEKYEQVPGNLNGVVIGEVVACRKHPNADKLSLTQVDIGNDTVLPIVCGAPNVAEGQKVAVAVTGTTLHPYGGEHFRLKKVKIRGEISEGMICAEDELGLGPGHEGILVLDTDVPNGTPAADFFNLQKDVILEIGLTPNRADAASHIGVARDLRALLGTPLQWPDISHFEIHNNKAPVEVVVQNTDACPRYSGLTITGIQVGESPVWLKQKLQSIGQVPINSVVDVTNFVLHEMGQPLHAFDLDKIAGRTVVVKTPDEGTPFVTLDGKARTLTGSDLMICDADGGMCIAGVFGGLHSGVTDQTTSVFLESACFNPDYIRKTSMVHALKTDAAFRYERGTDPEITVYALKRAALLICSITGGRVSSDITDIYPKPEKPRHIAMRYRNIDRLIGKRIDRSTMEDILNRLDIKLLDKTAEGFVAVVPPYRVDVTREADVVEELLRIYGYDNIPLQTQTATDFLAEFPEIDPDAEQLKTSELLTGEGYYEIITNSLTKPEYAQQAPFLDADRSVHMINKLSEDLAVLRQSLLFTGLEVIRYNISHRQKNVRLFEFGKSYHRDKSGYIEKSMLSIWATGNYTSESWLTENRPLHFHDFFGVVLKIINKFIQGRSRHEIFEHPAFEYCLKLTHDSQDVSIAGLLSQDTTRLVDLREEIFYAEIDFKWLIENGQTRFSMREIPKFPEVRRDLSLVIDRGVTFEEIRGITQEKEFEGVLKDVNVFDYYEGESLGKDKKAYALSFILQDDKKTLTDKDIDRTMERLMRLYETKIGAIIRK